MKLYDLKCPHCGGKLELSQNPRIANCRYCGCDFYIEFEKDCHPADEFEESIPDDSVEDNVTMTKDPDSPEPNTDYRTPGDFAGSGCVLILFGLMIVWLSFCSFCGFIG